MEKFTGRVWLMGDDIEGRKAYIQEHADFNKEDAFMNFIKSFLLIGVCYGLIACLKDGYGMNTYLFEYFLAYGCVSITSLFKKQILDDKKPFKGMLFLIISVILAIFW